MKKLIFVNGPGGSGKSYLHNTIITFLHKINVNVLPVAWTGIAANLLQYGRTVHTAFKLPLNINECTVCNVLPNTVYGEFMKQVEVLIMDEISMVSTYAAFEAIDRLFKDLCKTMSLLVIK